MNPEHAEFSRPVLHRPLSVVVIKAVERLIFKTGFLRKPGITLNRTGFPGSNLARFVEPHASSLSDGTRAARSKPDFGRILTMSLLACLLAGGCATVQDHANMKSPEKTRFELSTPELGDYRFPARARADRHGISLHSSKGRLAQLLGFWRSLLLSLTSPYTLSGELVAGELERPGSSTSERAVGKMRAFPFGPLDARECANSGGICIELARGDRKVGTIRQIQGAGPVTDYSAIVDAIATTIETHYYNPGQLEQPWYGSFMTRLQDLARGANDDLDFVVGGFLAVSELPVSHFGIERHNACKRPPPPGDGVSHEWISETVLHVKVRHLAAQSENIDRIAAELAQAGRSNTIIIIDLTRASGGEISAMRLAGMLFADGVVLNAGYFVTADWWRKHQQAPSAGQLGDVPHVGAVSVEQLQRVLQEQPLVRIEVTGDGTATRQKVFVLTSSSTGSAAEVLAQFLSEQDRATLVGQPTAGKMLSSGWRCLGEGWMLQLPETGYLTPGLVPLEGNPVKPDIAVPANRALQHVLETIGQ